jgi:hypothetical protein
MSMTTSQLNTISIPQYGGGGVGGVGADPAKVFTATRAPFRVAVRNVGGNVLMLAHNAGDLTQNPASAVYQLPPGATETLVLTPQQSLYAAAVGGGGSLSFAASEAIQTKWMES